MSYSLLKQLNLIWKSLPILTLLLPVLHGSLIFTTIDPLKSNLVLSPWKCSAFGVFQFKFRTGNAEGLLLYVDDSGEKRGLGNYLNLQLKRGEIHLRIQKSGKRRTVQQTMKLGNSLNDREWHHVIIRRDFFKLILQVDQRTDLILLEGDDHLLPLMSRVYMAGLPQHKTNAIDTFAWHVPRFIGCLSSIKMSRRSSMMLGELVVEETGVERGCVDSCLSGSCLNGGQCVNDFYKRTCDCRETAYEGNNCTNVAESIFLTGFDYLDYLPIEPRNLSITKISMRFRTNTENGLLAVMESNPNQHFTIELHNRLVTLNASIGYGSATASLSPDILSNEDWHLLEVIRRETRIQMSLDNRYTVNLTMPGGDKTVDMMATRVHFGGYFVPLALASSQSKRRFNGCLQQVYFNDVNIISTLLQTGSTEIQVHGSVGRGCPSHHSKPAWHSKNNHDPSTWKSTFDWRSYRRTIPITYRERSDTPILPVKRHPTEEDQSVSEPSIIAIVIGCLIGAALLCGIGFGLRKKYSGTLMLNDKRYNEHTSRMMGKSTRVTVLKGDSIEAIHSEQAHL